MALNALPVCRPAPLPAVVTFSSLLSTLRLRINRSRRFRSSRPKPARPGQDACFISLSDLPSFLS